MFTTADVRRAMLQKLLDSSLEETDAKRLKFAAYTAEQSKTLKLPANAAGFQLPYFDVKGKLTGFYRYRYLETTLRGFDQLTGRKPLRYTQPGKTLNEVYLPPYIKWDAYLAGGLPLLITEGELKAACATKLGLPTLGLGGVWCFMSKANNLPLLPLLESLPLRERRVILCYDSDGATNPDVALAESVLAKRLTEKGAAVELARLPPAPDGSKMGLDDYLVMYGVKAFQERILEDTIPYRRSAALHELNQKVVMIFDPCLIYDYEHQSKMSPHNFVHANYAHLSYQDVILDTNGDPRPKDKRTAAEWLKWPHRAQLRGLTYAPGKAGVTEDRKLNMWPGWGVANAVKGDISPWIELLDHLFGDKRAEREWFERWCAFPIQNPGYKMASAAVLWGVVHGSGKTMVGHTLMRLYGANSAEIKDADLVDSRFEWAENKQFVLADDITGEEGNRRLTRKFMTMITQKQMRLNPKYVPSYSVPDCINYYFTANDPDTLHLDDGDRRFFIHEVLNDKLEVEFRQRLVKWRDSVAGPEALMYHLLHLNLGDFDPQAEAMQTTAKRDMTLMGKSVLGVWVARLKENPDAVLNGKLRGDLFTAEELYAIYDPLGDKRASPNALGRELKRAGFQAPALGSPLRTSTGMKRVIAVRNGARWAAATHKAAIAHYEEHHAIVKKF